MEAVDDFVSALKQGPNIPPFIYGIEGENLDVSELYTNITNIIKIERNIPSVL